jgi:hypothetical protein
MGEKLKLFKGTDKVRVSTRVAQFPAREIKIREKKIKGIQIGKDKFKLFLFADDTILYSKDTKGLHQKLLDLLKVFFAK